MFTMWCWVQLGVLIIVCHYSNGQFTCHCKYGAACNTMTGECANACANAWTGPGCQYSDMALNRYSRHLDNTSPAHTANEANDGNLNTCSNTNDAGATRTVAPWWRVYFPDQKPVRGLIITAKLLGFFERGFNITVETIPDDQKHNSNFYPDVSNVTLCYRHQPGTTLLSTFDIYCTDTLVGNQVRIQLSDTDTQLILCEVNIFDIACLGLQWGELCQNTCGHCVSNAQCDVITGVCRTGCSAGYKAPTCTEECEAGSYGQGCVNSCSHNCKTVCNHVSGSCNGNCKPGWKGVICGQECSDGTYGEGCNQQCSSNCRGGYQNCNHATGVCTHNCNDGWQDSQCNVPCKDGTYGEGCRKQCSSNCRGGFPNCHHVTGICTQNCSDGWLGLHCNDECSDGTYGEGCGQQCSSNCRGGFPNCLHVNGICTKMCKDGWLGTYCLDACAKGYYGNKCRQKCSENCLYDNITCNHVNGKCEGGCVAGWTKDTCKEELKKEDPAASPIGGIIGGILAAVVVIGATVLVFFLYRRRQKRQRRQHLPPAEISESKEIRDATYANSTVFMDIADDRDVNDTEQDTVYDSIIESAIYLSDLKECIIKHSISSKLEDEFKSIPYGLQYPTTAALKVVNRSKNRYKDMYPYDHSRVILKSTHGDSDSDYINACYVDGYKTEKAFIAAQGPTSNNVVDFWRMIWEKNVDTIVMITNPVENGKMKCKEYWKNTEIRFSVTVTSEESFDMMIVRQMQLTSTFYEGSKTVTQYHFTAWSEESTPDGPTGFVLFFLKCRKNFANKVSPIVVHCSDGVGRTGTFIALDYLYEQGKDLGYVDVYGVVQKLRQQRVNAVQTKGQYVFLHEVMHETLVLPSPMSTLEFPETYATLLQLNEGTGKTRLLKLYEDIGEVLLSQQTVNNLNEIKKNGDDFSTSKDPENEKRNRYADILVANEFRPLLSTIVKGCNNYINAVFVQSHRDSRGFLLSQAPLAYTAVDYCRLILERSITCIVSFDYDQIKQNEKYLPSKGKLTIGPFETYVDSKEDNGYVILNRHRLVYKDKALDVQHLVYKDWPAGQKVPPNMASLLKLVEAVQAIQRSIDGPILVHCLNGAEKSGLFVVLLNVMERLKVDQDIAIPQIIRLTRRRRQQIIPNYEQYRFCHDVMMRHVEENSAYADHKPQYDTTHIYSQMSP